MNASALTLNDTLNRLLFEHKIRPTQLARKINVPQATIQRLTVGSTTRPHRSTLEAIAGFFNISVEQLLGEEAIPGFLSMTQEKLEASYKKIPILDNLLHQTHKEIITDALGGNKMFAIRTVDNAMEPLFPENTLLIIDPDIAPRDRNFVLVRLEGYKEVLFRQLISDGPDLFIKALSADFQKFEMKKIKNDIILGVLVQTKRDYISN